MSYRRLFAVALVVMGPATASAQFTTFIPPQSRARDSVQAVAATQTAKADSVTRAGVTNMTTWVDSAAGTVRPHTVADSLAATNRPGTGFANGSAAPMTASPLPALLLAGAISLFAGLVLLGNPRGRGSDKRA